ncbi:MAG: glycosyltransferase family 2 protein [Actinomycetota bacterium]
MNPSPPSGVDITIAILSWNARGYLRRCLASLFSPSDPEALAAWEKAGRPLQDFPAEQVSWEVIVVDQQSLDGSAEMVEAEFPGAKLVRQAPNLGFAGGNNVAYRHASGRYFLLLNSDTVMAPGSLTELVRFADAHPRAGLIGPKLLNPDGSLQYSCRHFPTLAAGIFRHTPFARFEPKGRFTADYLMESWDHASVREVDWLSGACLLARREMIDEIGGLDDGYFMYFEDVDWAHRAHRAGWEVLYTPQPVVIHEIGRSSDRRPKRMIVMHHQSAYRFFSRNTAFGRNFGTRGLLALGLSIRAGLTLARNEAIRLKARLDKWFKR